MSRKRLLLPFVVGCLAALGIASPAAAASGGVKLQIVAVRKADFVQVWESVQVPSQAPGVIYVDVPVGAEAFRLGSPGQIVRVTAGEVEIQPSGANVVLLYRLLPSQPLVWDETFRQRVASAILMFGPGIYPSGLASAPFRYVTDTALGGTRLKVFSATDLPRGQTVLWPMTLGHPDQPVANAFLAGIVALPIAGLVWGWLRLRDRGAHPGPKSAVQKAR